MIVSNIGRKITSPVRRAYHRRRGNRLKKRAQNFSKVEGLENACLHFSNESKLHFFASEPENDMLLGSPQIKKIHKNWKTYGFRSIEEAKLYTTWVIFRETTSNGLDGSEESDGVNNYGEILESYTIEDFRDNSNLQKY
ncbi:MAG: hypothetical protein QGF74_02900 [Candidatus Nanoarchaeia archaeon]|jgi:hypothetical protein|nr:hypothetical protein [Candidatus Nanoarchaeia archaeon]|tara:strand:- start:27384 stop:27800 length:417 start_codon:yes stop_codon:yes gene_type:complete